MHQQYILLLIFLVEVSLALVQLKTSTTVRGYSQQQVQTFLAIPSNWPKIVVSSWSVEGTSINIPLKQNSQVKEIFGLPPILPLCVSWTCRKSTKDTLDVQSPDGVSGLATDCRMLFDIQESSTTDKVTIVNLTMEYEPTNILATLAIPVLILDNVLALKVLLPNQLQSKTRILQFQKLMGILYGIAGLAHFVDLLFGDSVILQMTNCPSFYNLNIEGKVLALTWCAAGPAAFILSRVRGYETRGLIGYGLVEVFCAAIVSSFTNALDPFLNALGVQAIVAASFIYSSRKEEES